MRQIDWDRKLSEEDVQWLLASGMYDVDRRVAENAEKFGTEVSETPKDEEDDDDYDEWSKSDLEKEVTARNGIARDREEVSEVTVIGTGSNGGIRKEDLIKALRLWDQENPGVLDTGGDE